MGARREILASHYQRSSMCFTIGIARLAPTGLLAAKNNSKMGEFIEFRKVRLVGATLAKVDSRRVRYNSAICSLPEERCCPRSMSNILNWGDGRYRPCQCSREPNIRSSWADRAGVGFCSIGIILAIAIRGNRIQQSIFRVSATASTVLQLTWVAKGSRNTTAQSKSPISLQNRGSATLESSETTWMLRPE